MTIHEIALLELFLVGGIGVLLVISALLISFITEKRNRSCTEVTSGTVIKYRYLGDGNISPVVSYRAMGSVYTKRKKFNSIRTVGIKGFPLHIEEDAYEDEKGNLHVKTGPVANMKKLAETLWPMGSSMKVYYNPDNPKVAYVDRPLKNRFVITAFLLTGLFIILLSVVLFYVIQM